MGKIGKVVSIIVFLCLAVIAGLVAFIHYYLTEERVKAIVIPQAEAALGRKVAIGDIKIGLLSGITIHDFLIKEADGKDDFVSTRAFVLSYELLPLLQKKLIISEVRFDEPAVQITRDNRGNFNFSTLAVLTEKKEAPEKAGKPKSAPAALPLALTINQIKLNKAHIRISDQMHEIPTVDATTSARLNVALGQTMQDLRYNGTFDFDAAVAQGTAKANLNGKGSVSQKDMAIALDAEIDGENVHAEAEVKSFRKSPDATITVSSRSLNIDKLLATVAGMPDTGKKKPPKTGAARGGSGEIIANTLPPGLVARGTVEVDNAIYRGLTASDLSLAFDLNGGVLTVKELSAKAYSGKLDSNMIVDLNQPGPSYAGNIGIASMAAGDFSSALVAKLAGMFTGSLQSAVTFSGAGTTWQQISRVLTADGSFTLTDGGIKGTPVSNSIANLLGLQELNNISYKNISGTFNIVEGGKVKIKTNLQGTDLDAEAQGMIGLDGSLDLPLTFHLSPPLADKLRSRASFTKYLTDDEGGTTLHLKLAGSLKNPQPTLDMQGVKKQVEKTIQKEVLKQLEGSGQDTEQKPSPDKLLKGIFGK